MQSAPRDMIRTLPFWLIFAASALTGITNSASTPVIPGYVRDALGGGPDVAGLIVALAAGASMLSMPAAGALADRRGYRTVTIFGCAVAATGMALLALLPWLWGASLSRVLFGLGNAAALAVILAWLVAITPLEQRGRALSYFGLNVWIGLAIGPQLGTAVESIGGPTTVFYVCAGLQLASILAIVALPRPQTAAAAFPAAGRAALPRSTGREVWPTLRSVWIPGVVAAAAWSGEGIIITFLIVHLVGAGVPSASAALVFAVFAVSVIAARLALASLPDRIGPLRATAISLTALTIGLATLALAHDFWIAALGATFIGIGFSPLYPSLTMLAARGLTVRNRGLGLGLFASFTSIGYGGGALLGGFLIAAASSTLAFLIVAGLQLVALAILIVFTREDPLSRPDPVTVL